MKYDEKLKEIVEDLKILKKYDYDYRDKNPTELNKIILRLEEIIRCSNDIAVAESKIQPKRNPDSEGILLLTDEEKHEFSNRFVKHTNFIYYIRYIGSRIHMQFLDGRYDDYCDNCMAIMWLAERFNLSGEDFSKKGE